MFELQKGASIIEASAGTGKTYTLCRIVLKLIVEKAIPIDRILAITFTQAATEELNTRIRALLRDCVNELESGKVTDEVLKEILSNDSIDSELARKRLRHSLETFDEASISTIHGFCKRSLDLVSLESDIGFDANLEQIEEELIARLKDEYIRIHILEKSALLSVVFDQNPKYKKRLDLIARECAAHPYALLEPKPDQFKLESLENAFLSALEAIEPFLEKADSMLLHLKKNVTLFKTLNSPEKREALTALARRKRPLLNDLSLLDTLDGGMWKKAVKKSGEHLGTPSVFERVTAFKESLAFVFDALIANYRDWLFEHLRAEKERRNVISFNDLLHILNRALQDEHGDSVVQTISERYDAALVDEFQDTDPVQYRIVQQLFGGDSKYLFFIGDPKQAIYRFRGADIFAYFEATNSNDLKRIQLSNNYRSTPSLVEGVNAIFESAPDGFAFEQIRFSPANAARETDSNLPLKVEALGLNEALTLSPSEASRLTAETSAQDLAQRVIDDSNFDLGKVAFLVNRNAEADLLMESLAKRGIDSVIKAERSVFRTNESENIALLLETLANPSKRHLVRALLLTTLGGYNWQNLLEDEFETDSYEIISFLHDWSRNWYSTNFDAAFHQLLDLTGASQRLLSRAGGEREYANYCQLSELLQNEDRIHRSTPNRLLTWLQSKTDENVSTHEDWQTRLRSDEGKPQIITIHKSKGLQFPVVICPFMTSLRPKAKREHALYHATERDNRLVIDLSPDEGTTALEAAEREEYAEHLRLIYVALTRAVDECHVYLVPEEPAKNTNTRPSSFCQLLLGSADANTLYKEKNVSSALLKHIQQFPTSSIECSVREIAQIETSPTLMVSQTDSPTSQVQAKLIQKNSIPIAERVLSFSAITHLAHSLDSPHEDLENDEPILPSDSDPLEAIIDTQEEPTGPSIFNLPKGAHTGNLVHNILEQLDFQKPDTLKSLINDSFNRLRYGYHEYKPVLDENIRLLLKKRLTDSISLDRIAPRQRIAELEFAYPSSPDMLRKIANIFKKYPSNRIPSSWIAHSSLGKANVRASMLRGFIDLVFESDGKLYILDWKTNHLGNQAAAYSQSAMTQAMSQHNYYLQYCLYCIALKRHLQTRWPETPFYERFGGVFYLFIRGVEDSGDNGVFFDRPNEAFLDALDEAIMQ